MKTRSPAAKFNDILDACPVIRPIFVIKKLPAFLTVPRIAGLGIKVGKEVFYTPDGCANLVARPDVKLVLGARNVSFVEYRNMNPKSI